MTPDDRARIRALADRATPGPWHVNWEESDRWWVITAAPHDDMVCPEVATVEAWGEGEAKFIAAAREAVPALLDENAELRAERDEYDPILARCSEILTGVANALKGPPPELTSWSHHDLAEKAAAMVTRAVQAERLAAEQIREAQTEATEAVTRADRAEAERDQWHELWRQRGAKQLQAEARIKAVRDLHVPDRGWRQDNTFGDLTHFCRECGLLDTAYPCPTIHALEG